MCKLCTKHTQGNLSSYERIRAVRTVHPNKQEDRTICVLQIDEDAHDLCYDEMLKTIILERQKEINKHRRKEWR